MNREIQLLIRFLDSIREYEHESGNSVYNDERESKEFVDIFLTTKEYQSLPKEEVRLTEDLLLKLGFTKGNDVYRNAFSKVVLKTDFYLRPSCGGGYYWGFNISDEKNDCELNDVRPIKFVHELQNLLFAITGEQFNQEEVDLVSNGTFQNDKDWNTPSLKVPKEEMDTRGTFNEWYEKNITRFHQSQFDFREMGYSAYLFGLDSSVNQEEEK